MQKLRTLALALLVSLCGCRKAQDYAQTFIEKPGVFECFGRELVVAVSEPTGQDLNYTISRKQTRTGPASPALHKNSGWTIYPATADTIWIYDGEREVTLVEFLPNGGAKFSSSLVVPGLIKRAPQPFVQRVDAHAKAERG